MPHYSAIEDLRRHAQRRLPRMFYDYVDAGSWTESTYRANSAELARLTFQQRVAVDIRERSLATTVLGREQALPLGIAPTGLAGMMWPDGEIHAARAAHRAGVPYVLSMMSICSLEDVVAGSGAPVWLQVYLLKDRDFIERLLARAEAAACPALVLTLDLQVGGRRHKDERNGLAVPPRLRSRALLDLLRRPAWCAAMLGTRRRRFGNVVGHAAGVSDLGSLSAWASQYDAGVGWAEVAAIRRRWPGQLVLKGITSPLDARSAVNVGADALIVSNHGGRQLDGAPAAIESLPAVVDAVGREIEVHFDSGIRSGQDVLRALALGARSTYIGRAALYGLAAAGEAGVQRCLAILKDELSRTLGMCGLTDVRQAGPQILFRGQDGPAGRERADRSATSP